MVERLRTNEQECQAVHKTIQSDYGTFMEGSVGGGSRLSFGLIYTPSILNNRLLARTMARGTGEVVHQ